MSKGLKVLLLLFSVFLCPLCARGFGASNSASISDPIVFSFVPLKKTFQQFEPISLKLKIVNCASDTITLKKIILNMNGQFLENSQEGGHKLVLELLPSEGCDLLQRGDFSEEILVLPSVGSPTTLLGNFKVCEGGDFSSKPGFFFRLFPPKVAYAFSILDLWTNTKQTIDATIIYSLTAIDSSKRNANHIEMEVQIIQLPLFSYIGGALGCCLYFLFLSTRKASESESQTSSRFSFKVLINSIISIWIFIFISGELRGTNLPISFDVKHFWGGVMLGLFTPKVTIWIAEQIFVEK
jgi:hypothetical protein